MASGGAIVAPLTSSAVLEPGGSGRTLPPERSARVRHGADDTRSRLPRAFGVRLGIAGVDCSGLTRADSAGVAVLLDWLAEAKRNARHLRYEGLPDSVRAIARISEVDDLLESGV